MANRTVGDAKSVRGTNPQYLVEKIIRTRIYESKYWKEECFALTAELLVDKAMALDHIGGTFGGNVKPTPFLCLILKMLQIQPEKDIVVEFIRNEDYKYARALGAFYMRLVGTSLECFKYLEPLYNDYRKMKRKGLDGVVSVLHMDEFIDELLHEERVCDIILPRIQKRDVLEETEQLEQRKSALDDDLEDLESDEDVDIKLSIRGEISTDSAPTVIIASKSAKYARALGAFYMRLVGTSLECFKYLEPLYNDYRKMKRKGLDGVVSVLHMDEFIDELLHEERVCDIILPRIQKRDVLEETEQLEQRKSALDDDLEDLESDEDVDIKKLSKIEKPLDQITAYMLALALPANRCLLMRKRLLSAYLIKNSLVDFPDDLTSMVYWYSCL
eukprot:gene4665-20948_t